MVVGCLGDIVFQVSEATVRTLDNMTWSGSARYAVHERHLTHALTEIADVIANSPTPGVVKLYVLMNGGELANEEVKGEVLAACSADEVRPLTDQVFVEDADVVDYDIDFTYYIQTGSAASAADIAAAVQMAVDEFNAWQCARLGRDINPSRLINMLMQTGIKRVELRAPAFTVLRDGSNKTVPQVAFFGTAAIVNGGYEDE